MNGNYVDPREPNLDAENYIEQQTNGIHSLTPAQETELMHQADHVAGVVPGGVGSGEYTLHAGADLWHNFEPVFTVVRGAIDAVRWLFEP